MKQTIRLIRSRGKKMRRSPIRAMTKLSLISAFVLACGLAWSVSAGTAEEPKAEQKPANAAEKSAKPAEKSAQKKKPKKPGGVQKNGSVDAAAIAFAREHHPELADLVTELQKSNPAEFKTAVRDLAHAKQRLEKIRDRSPDRYQFALEGWKLDSRLRLVAARMSMSDDPGLEAELNELVRQRVNLRLQQLQDERSKLQNRIAQSTDRLQKVEQSIASIEQDRDAAAAEDLERIRKSVRKRQPAPAKAKPTSEGKDKSLAPVKAEQPNDQPSGTENQ